MSTLVEELKRAEENEQKQNQLRKSIMNFCTKQNVYDTLKKGASKRINVQFNNDYIRLETKNYAPQIKSIRISIFNRRSR